MDKLKILGAIAVIVAFSIVGYKYYIKTTTPRPKAAPPSINTKFIVGIHDPKGVYDSHTEIKMQNVYFSWDEQPEKMLESIKKNDSLNRVSLVTVEPWQKVKTYAAGRSLFNDITRGEYDDIINSTCSTLAKSDLPVIIRWGHEMELNTSRYPWSGQDPEAFKAGYRYFVDMCKTKSSHFKFMWSPAGENNSEKYWPGDEYVDYIGLSIYSFDEWDFKYIGHQRNFIEVLAPKYSSLSHFNKPFMIAETGVTGSDAVKQNWVSELAQNITRFPLVKGLVYFNSTDLPGAWGTDLGIADFRIKESTLNYLLELAK